MSTVIALGLILFVVVFLIGRGDRFIYATTAKAAPKVRDPWFAFKLAMIPIAAVLFMAWAATR